MTPHEKELLIALENSGADASVADILRRNRMAMTAEARKKLSSQLCRQRDKGLLTSFQQDGINYWNLTEAGWKMLGRDTAAPEPVAESPDIAPELPDQLEYEPDGPDDINPALVRESLRICPIPRFTGLPGALFVLDTLAVAYCPGMPAYQAEIERIADYLRSAAA